MSRKLKAAQLATIVRNSTFNTVPMGSDFTKAVETLSNPKLNPTLTIWEILNPKEDQYFANQFNYRENIPTAALYEKIVDVSAITQRADNLLNAPTGTTWEAGYRNALARFMKDNAEIVSLTADIYSWNDFAMSRKKADGETEIVALFNIREDEWSEFAGSDNYSDRIQGVQAEAVFSTGESRHIRWEGKFEDIIKKLVLMP